MLLRANAAVDTTADTNIIKGIVTEAFAAPATLVVIPETNNFPPIALTAATAPTLDASIKIQATQSAIKIAEAHTQEQLGKIYAPQSLIGHQLYGEIQNAIEGQSKGRYRALGGGVRDIDWRHILINGNQAAVTVAATLWSNLKYTDEFGKVHTVTPTTGYVKVYTLEKIKNQWLISGVVDDNLQADQLKVNHPTPQPVVDKTVVPDASVRKGKVNAH